MFLCQLYDLVIVFSNPSNCVLLNLCMRNLSYHNNYIVSKHLFLVEETGVHSRAVLTKIFQLTSITKNLNDAHELSMKTAAILFFSVDCCH